MSKRILHRFPVTALDRLSWAGWGDPLRLSPAMELTWDERPEEGSVARALELALRRFPLLTCRLVSRGMRMVWEGPYGNPLARILICRDLPGKQEDPVEERQAMLRDRIMMEPHDPARGEGAKIHRIALPDGKEWWMATLHHMLGDGRSAFQFMDSTLQFLADPMRDSTPESAPRDAFAIWDALRSDASVNPSHWRKQFAEYVAYRALRSPWKAVMARVCDLSLILAQKRWIQQGISLGLKVLPLESPPLDRTAEFPVGTGSDPAYINFTSGSSGPPKAVQVTHRNVVRLIHSPDYARLGPDRILLHHSPLSFDATTFEIWGALLHGGTCVIQPARIPTPSLLESVIREHRVTTVFLTTALFNALIDEAPRCLASVDEILTGGERVSVDHMRRALAALPGTRIRHVYGPTETTTFATHLEVPRTLAEDAHTIPIGRPICNSRVYILDGNRTPVPIGIPGEIYVGGDGVADGYWGDPRSTAEKFLPDPFAPSGGRIYRTGDRGRFLKDGSIEFLGRIDRQVKIRGFRIEPEEIEATLMQLPGIRQAAVETVERAGGERSLAAFVAASEAASLDPDRILALLRERLPEYMIPSSITVLPSLPLSKTGKVDRSALPQPSPCAVTPPEPASHEGERVLQEIWEQVFRIRPIGVTDHFFRMGGHSLLAARLLSRIKARLGIELPMAALFDAPTIREQARLIAAKRIARRGLVNVQKGAGRPPFIFLPGGDGSALRLWRLARRIGRDQPFFSFQSDDWRAGDAIESFDAIAARYVDELVAEIPEGPLLLGGFCTGGLIALEMGRRLVALGRRVPDGACEPADPGKARFASRLPPDRLDRDFVATFRAAHLGAFRNPQGDDRRAGVHGFAVSRKGSRTPERTDASPSRKHATARHRQNAPTNGSISRQDCDLGPQNYLSFAAPARILAQRGGGRNRLLPDPRRTSRRIEFAGPADGGGTLAGGDRRSDRGKIVAALIAPGSPPTLSPDTFAPMRGNRWTIYFPSKTGPYDRDWGFPIRYLSPIPRDRCKLHAAWCPIPNARGALLHFHGNRGNITHSFDLVPAFHRMGLSVFLLDYRGFGKSEGRPSIRGILQDARAAYECVTHELAIPPSRIVLLGDSLGGGVAIHLAGRVPFAAVVIQSTFTSIPDLAGAHMHRFRWLRFFMRNRLPNLQAVRRVRAPKLFVQCRRRSRALLDGAPALRGRA